MHHSAQQHSLKCLDRITLLGRWLFYAIFDLPTSTYMTTQLLSLSLKSSGHSKHYIIFSQVSSHGCLKFMGQKKVGAYTEKPFIHVNIAYTGTIGSSKTRCALGDGLLLGRLRYIYIRYPVIIVLPAIHSPQLP